MSRSNEEDQRAVSSVCPNNTRSGASEPSVIVPSEGAAPTLEELCTS